MSLVGKKFPNITVDAMNEMGDTFKINILEEAQKKRKYYFLVPKISRMYVRQKFMRFRNI